MAAPKVQSLSQIIASLNPAYKPLISNINQRQAALPSKYEGRRQGLQQAKTNAFRDIRRGANASGMAFSGIPLEEQATYLGETFLPGMTNLEFQQNEEELEFARMLADLTKEQRLRALDIRSGQINKRDAYREAERERQFKAEQNRLQRGSGREPMSPFEVAFSLLSQARGSDGYVSPSTFRLARDAYIEAGGTNKKFMDQFWYLTGVDDPNSPQGKANNWQAYYYG